MRDESERLIFWGEGGGLRNTVGEERLWLKGWIRGGEMGGGRFREFSLLMEVLPA